MSGPAAGEGADTALARFILALRSRGVMDRRLLDACERSPRGRFLPAAPVAMLYEPVTLPLPFGEEATDPFTLARIVRALDLSPGYNVLEIGTGSGFLTAILARMVRSVVTVERIEHLHRGAATALTACGVRNVVLHHGDGLAFDSGTSRFDRIILNGSVAEVPPGLIDALSPEGMLLAPVNGEGGARMTLFRPEMAPEQPDSLPAWRLGSLKTGVPLVI